MRWISLDQICNPVLQGAGGAIFPVYLTPLFWDKIITLFSKGELTPEKMREVLDDDAKLKSSGMGKETIRYV